MTADAQDSSEQDGADELGPDDGDGGRHVDIETAKAILDTGEIELVARMPYSSNGTFLVHVTRTSAEGEEVTAAAVYKPVSGERPLWDFPAGLSTLR